MNILWRDSGKTIRFFGVDGRAAIGLIFVLVHISVITICLSIFMMLAFSTLERFDYALPNAARKFRVMISGRKKRTVHAWAKRRYRSS